MNTFPPLIIRKIADVIVGNDTPNRMTGPELVEFFNEFGFNDDYNFPNTGITTADLGNGLSRTEYTRKRLKKLNESNQMDNVLAIYLENCKDKDFAEKSISEITGSTPKVSCDNISRIVSFKPRSQFDDIKDGVPTVFISYSWDDPEHNAWVKKLADDLRKKHNICSLLDRYNSAGTNLVEFMNQGINVSDRVLMIGTPIYKQRFENGIGTGVKFEEVIITSEIYHDTNTCKFIPILRRGERFEDSFITIIASLRGFDFRDDGQYESNLQELANEIYNRETKAPSLCRVPIISSNTSIEQIPDEYKGERWLYELLKYFSFLLMDDYFSLMPNRFDMRVLTMFEYWNGIICSSVYHISDDKLKQCIGTFFQPWKDICEYGWKYYSGSNNGKDYVFYGAEFDIFKTPEQEEAFEKLISMTKTLYEKYKAFVDFLDLNYPKIDREKTSLDFVSFLKKEDEKLMAGLTKQ